MESALSSIMNTFLEMIGAILDRFLQMTVWLVETALDILHAEQKVLFLLYNTDDDKWTYGRTHTGRGSCFRFVSCTAYEFLFQVPMCNLSKP